VTVIWNGTEYLLNDLEEESGNILILRSWKEEWYQYMCNVLTFFCSEHPELSSDLLIYDLEADEIQKIIDFAGGFGVELEGKLRIRGNTTKSVEPHIQSQLEKWDDIVRKEPMLLEMDQFEGETERILAHCSTKVNDSIDTCSCVV